MSKSKKKNEKIKVLSVPDTEQPYELPENWIWTTCGNISKVIRGVSYKKNQVENVKNSKNCLILRGGNIQNGELINQSDNVYVSRSLIKNEQFLKVNDIVLVSSTGSSKVIGKAASVTIDFENESFGAFITLLRPSERINKEYFGYFFQSNSYRKVISDLAKGSNINNIKADYLQNLRFPLPPLDEQKRIAEKLKFLLTKVEDAKQLIGEVKESIELRRASILNSAFKGELINSCEFYEYKDNRDIPYTLPKGWKWKRFKEVTSIKSNLVNPIEYQESPHIAPDNIEKKTGRLLGFNTIKEDGVISSKHLFKKGQIIYSKIRPYLSKVIIADFDGLCSADMYPIETELNTEFLYYYMLSPIFVEMASSAGSRSVLPKINQKELGDIFIPVPDENIQDQLVNKIRFLIEKENLLMEVLESEDAIDALKQSILNKAYRGKLGTNNSNDNSALELLKGIAESNLK